jgi:hypothetical protein
MPRGPMPPIRNTNPGGKPGRVRLDPREWKGFDKEGRKRPLPVKPVAPRPPRAGKPVKPVKPAPKPKPIRTTKPRRTR